MFAPEKNLFSNVKSKDLKHRDVKHIRIDNVTTLYGIYEFQETIGHGSYGNVLSVVEKATGMNYAMKIVNKLSTGSKVMVDVRREIAILSHVDHPNIVVLCKVYESYKKIYMVLEKCGDNLLNVLRKKGPFSERINRKLMKQIVGAVHYLHKNHIVHRDLKLENILMSKNPIDANDEYFIKLVDFGLSVIKTGPGIKSMLSDTCGTIIYMAPEILQQHNYSELCDVWSIGVILYVLLMGTFPFNAPQQDEVITKILKEEPEYDRSIVSPDAEDLLRSIFKKDPVNRITALEILKHPWLLENKIVSRKDETIIDYMKKWRKELTLPGEESDWIGSFNEHSDYSIFPKSSSISSRGADKPAMCSTSSERSDGTNSEKPELSTVSDPENTKS